jgi:hypothetical protein
MPLYGKKFAHNHASQYDKPQYEYERQIQSKRFFKRALQRRAQPDRFRKKYSNKVGRRFDV